MTSSTASYTFTAEQDNWVHAENGGVQKSKIEQNIYLSRDVVGKIIGEYVRGRGQLWDFPKINAERVQ